MDLNYIYIYVTRACKYTLLRAIIEISNFTPKKGAQSAKFKILKIIKSRNTNKLY